MHECLLLVATNPSQSMQFGSKRLMCTYHMTKGDVNLIINDVICERACIGVFILVLVKGRQFLYGYPNNV